VGLMRVSAFFPVYGLSDESDLRLREDATFVDPSQHRALARSGGKVRGEGYRAIDELAN
jgi:hypothetical protein